MKHVHAGSAMVHYGKFAQVFNHRFVEGATTDSCAYVDYGGPDNPAVYCGRPRSEHRDEPKKGRLEP